MQTAEFCIEIGCLEEKQVLNHALFLELILENDVFSVEKPEVILNPYEMTHPGITGSEFLAQNFIHK